MGNDFKLDSLKDNKEGGISFKARYHPKWNVSKAYFDYEGKLYKCCLWIYGWDEDLSVSARGCRIM